MNHKSDIPILILAAGSSFRLGSPKQLLELNGKTLLQKAIATALEVSDFVGVILGANQEKIQPTIQHFPIQIIFNKNWSEGMSASIRAGINFLQKNKQDSKASIIMLCDQPYVDSFLLKKIIADFEESENSIVACQYDNRPAVPALFEVSFFEKLKNLKGDQGAKQIDIDTKEDYNRLRND